MLLQDLLNLGAGDSSAAPAASSSGFDPLGSLSDASFGAPTAAEAFPAITAFSKDGVSVSFAFSKPPGQPNVTDITATYTNSDAAPVTGFSLQVRQPSMVSSLKDSARGEMQDGCDDILPRCWTGLLRAGLPSRACPG